MEALSGLAIAFTIRSVDPTLGLLEAGAQGIYYRARYPLA